MNPRWRRRPGNSGTDVLLSAVEMEVFAELEKYPANCASSRERLGLHPRAACDFLDSLWGLGFLDRRECVSHNSAETNLFLDKLCEVSIG